MSHHHPATVAATPPSEPEEANPLRMLRSGGLTVVRPKIRGNKHNPNSSRDSREMKVLKNLISVISNRIHLFFFQGFNG